jgi:hypothetical protein
MWSKSQVICSGGGADSLLKLGFVLCNAFAAGYTIQLVVRIRNGS